jgi:asparagine synthase (glutamine-hydrolysing)
MTRLRGTDTAIARAAVRQSEPLPGASDAIPGSTHGFAGRIDGGVVRDVLGRVPVYTDARDRGRWSFNPGLLGEPEVVPAGHKRREKGDEQLWTLPDPDPVAADGSALDQIGAAVRASVDAVEGHPAIAFSGGVDSAAVATRLEGPLYVTGFPGSHDLKAAREAATSLGRELHVVALSHADIEQAIPRVVAATGRTNAMDVSIAVSLFLVAERAAADGHDRLVLGQGADELFGGYAKVAEAPQDSRVEADTVRGARREVVRTLPDELERDVLTLGAAGVEAVAPLLDDRVVAAALALPESSLVSPRGERKWGFRQAVKSWVPDSIASREKKAVQYGSLVERELDRLARQAGFKRRQDDHVERYVRSLVGSPVS